jgi:hypothetical protein
MSRCTHGQARARVRRRTALFILVAGLLSIETAAEVARRSLAQAAAAGDLARVQALIARGAHVDTRDEQGRTPLMAAAGEGRLAVVQALIAAKADVAASDREGFTPLIASIQAKDVAVARVLLAAGAPCDARHRFFGTALDLAERQGQRDLAALLRSHGARGSGKSVGDTVCARMWQGEGYCGAVTAIEWPYWRLTVTRLVGCEKGCPARLCSLWRPVGGTDAKNIKVGDAIRIEVSCLTHTGQPAGGR